MSKESFRDKILGSFRTYWEINSPNPTPPIFYEDDPNEKPELNDISDINQTINLSWLTNDLIFDFVGDQSFGTSGNIRIDHNLTFITEINTPFGHGSQLNDQLAKIVYDGMFAIKESNICVLVPTYQTIGRVDNWWVSAVSAEIQANEIL